MALSIARIYYPVCTLGPGQRIGIWTAGCHRKCEGCLSPELQSFSNGRDLQTDEILKLIDSIEGPIDGVTISGGEPFARPSALCDVMSALAERFDDIIIFTGYTYEELVSRNDPAISSVLEHCSVLIDGPFIKDLHTETGLRGSTNQRIHIFRNYGKYSELITETRQLQNILYGDKILTIGIP